MRLNGPVDDPREELRRVLLSPAEAELIDAHGATDAAVLLPLFGHPEDPGLVFTRRRKDLRRHGGEVSFPGGRPDWPSEPLLDAALREASEEIALEPRVVEIVGALPPASTVVTDYKVHPFVGLIPEETELEPNPAEVDQVLSIRISDLLGGFGRRRLVRRGVPFRTDTYVVGETLIWGATARILRTFLERIGRAPE